MYIYYIVYLLYIINILCFRYVIYLLYLLYYSYILMSSLLKELETYRNKQETSGLCEELLSGSLRETGSDAQH